MLTNDKICAILYGNIPPYILLQGVREERSDHPLSRLDIKTPSQAQTVVDTPLPRRGAPHRRQSPPGLCPVDMSLTFLQLCHAQTCGKCVPCRIGLGQLTKLIEMVLDGQRRHVHAGRSSKRPPSIIVEHRRLRHRHRRGPAGADGPARASGTTMRSTSSTTAAWAA